MLKHSNIQKIHVMALGTLIVTTLLTLVSYFYWDKPLAEYVNYYQFRQYLFFKMVIRFPELFAIASFLIIFGLILNFIKHPYFTSKKQHLFAFSVGLMATYAIKDVFKCFFSKVGYDFFHGFFVCGSYPSGHTTIAVFVATFFCYQWPSWSALMCIIPVLVSVGLIATNNHVLSDVIGGVGLGIIAGSYAYYFSSVAKS